MAASPAVTDLATFVPKRILVCQLRQLGDVVLTTPALELLRKRYPYADVYLLTEKKCLPLLENNPHLSGVLALDKKALTPFPRELAWYWKTARQDFDLVIDFQQLPRCRWVVAFSGAKVRLSYPVPWYKRPLYTHTAPMLPGYAAMSKVSLLAPLGITWRGERPRMYLTAAERAGATALLARLGFTPGQRLITVDATHRRRTRRWPIYHYTRLLRILADADPQLRFMPLWGPGEEEEIRTLASMCDCADRLLLPNHLLDLREAAACIATADLHIGNCSAPRHIAVALDTPTCTIQGSTGSQWIFPATEHRSVSAHLPCQPCESDTCPHRNCLEQLPPQVVAKAIMDLLSTTPHKNALQI